MIRTAVRVRQRPGSCGCNHSPRPSLLLAKAGSYEDVGSDGLNVGDKLNYTFDVTNTGDVTVSGVTISEDAFDLPGPIAITPPADTELSPDEIQQWTGVYILTQADIDYILSDNQVDNIASASGSDPNGGAVDSNQDPADVTITPSASLLLAKAGSYEDVGSDGLNVGDKLNYTFDVTNTGDVTVSGVTISEDAFDLPGPIAITPPADTELSPDEIQQWTGVYILTQADIDYILSDNQVDNIASASGSDPNGGAVDSNQDPADVTITPSASLLLAKAGSYEDVGSDGLNVGDKLNYTFDVTNTGDVTVSGVTISEDAFDLPGPIAITPPADTELSPDEIQQWTGVYILTQADIDYILSDNQVDNIASASGSDPNGGAVDSNQDPADVTITPSAYLLLAKAGSYEDVGSDGLNVGDKLNYTFDVTNTGDVTVSGVTISEDAFDLPGPIAITPPADAELSPDEIQQWTGVYILTQADIDYILSDNQVDNIASASGSDPNGGAVDSNQDPADVTITPSASLLLAKAGSYEDVGSDGLNVGDKLNYTFDVTNTGDVTVSGVTISEDAFDLPGPIAITPPADTELSPDEIQQWTGVYILTQADIDYILSDNQVDNIASASGSDPNGGAVDSNQDLADVTITPSASSVAGQSGQL